MHKKIHECTSSKTGLGQTNWWKIFTFIKCSPELDCTESAWVEKKLVWLNGSVCSHYFTPYLWYIWRRQRYAQKTALSSSLFPNISSKMRNNSSPSFDHEYRLIEIELSQVPYIFCMLSYFFPSASLISLMSIAKKKGGKL